MEKQPEKNYAFHLEVSWHDIFNMPNKKMHIGLNTDLFQKEYIIILNIKI